jgi:hypothetical protein
MAALPSEFLASPVGDVSRTILLWFCLITSNAIIYTVVLSSLPKSLSLQHTVPYVTAMAVVAFWCPFCSAFSAPRIPAGNPARSLVEPVRFTSR